MISLVLIVGQPCPTFIAHRAEAAAIRKPQSPVPVATQFTRTEDAILEGMARQVAGANPTPETNATNSSHQSTGWL